MTRFTNEDTYMALYGPPRVGLTGRISAEYDSLIVDDLVALVGPKSFDAALDLMDTNVGLDNEAPWLALRAGL